MSERRLRKITVVTPCYNAEKYIKETVESVINQRAVLNHRVELELIICDGKSSDNTVAIARSYGHPAITILSEKDNSMYEALAKGLRLATGDVCAYLNAGDVYALSAFDVVLDIFEQQPVQWLTGYNFYYNEQLQVVRVFLPFKYRRRLFACGMYSGRLPFVQQESTFWLAHLNQHLSLPTLTGFKYAGDYYMWHTFAQHADLFIVEAYLGGFRAHTGQLTATHLGTYYEEMKTFTRKPNLGDYVQALLDKPLWYGPPGLKKKYNRVQLLRFAFDQQRWV
jgi:glycosyltransferase involved in cell wall biosynthesis